MPVAEDPEEQGPCIMTKKHESFPLVDRTEPNLLEETFDYSLPPLIRFDGPMVEYIDGKPVKFDPTTVKTRDIFITDTTFRDGQQARPPYTVDQMVRIYDLLAEAGRAARRHPPDRVLPLHQATTAGRSTAAASWATAIPSAPAGSAPTRATSAW